MCIPGIQIIRFYTMYFTVAVFMIVDLQMALVHSLVYQRASARCKGLCAVLTNL